MGRDYRKQQIEWMFLIHITFCIDTIYQGTTTKQGPSVETS